MIIEKAFDWQCSVRSMHGNLRYQEKPNLSKLFEDATIPQIVHMTKGLLHINVLATLYDTAVPGL